MAEISATMVKTLREATNAGMMECKNALVEAAGNFDRAVAILREKGAAKAVKRASRAIREGRILARVTDDSRRGAMVEVNIETDFAARNERFGELVEEACATALARGTATLEALLEAKPVKADAGSLKELVTQTAAVIGENMGIGRVALMQVPDGKSGLIHRYIHPPAGRVSVLVQLACESDAVAKNPAATELAHNLCLQIAFSNPVGLDSKSVPADVIETEKQVYRNAAIKEGKPEKILDNIVQGRLRGFFKESCLLEQAYVKDEKKSVSDLVKESAKAAGGSIEVVAFVRYQLGEAAGNGE